ncbi:MAG TPA: cbb3-type cytochrome c oxidase subunit I, partial [Kiloniellales bacterium]|nr:cbb3-type cytochrome c oxidase subunit I [Kiloniellales bacterium]
MADTQTVATQRMDNGGAWLLGLLLLVAAVFGLFLAAGAHDPAMELHGMLFFGAAVLGSFALIARVTGKAPATPERYQDGVIRAGVIASVFWGVIGFLVGLVIACQLIWPELNLDLPWTTFGRLRPLHTSAVIFAFGGNVLICTSF